MNIDKQINNIMQINFEDEQMTLKTHNFALPQLHEWKAKMYKTINYLINLNCRPYHTLTHTSTHAHTHAHARTRTHTHTHART